MKYAVSYLAYDKDGKCLTSGTTTIASPDPISAKSSFEAYLKEQDERIAIVIVLRCTECEQTAIDFLKGFFKNWSE